MRKFYIGGSFSLHKRTNRNQYATEVLRYIHHIYVPTRIDVDHKRGCNVKAELLDRGTEHVEAKIFAQNDTAGDTARCLATSVGVFEKWIRSLILGEKKV